MKTLNALIEELKKSEYQGLPRISRSERLTCEIKIKSLSEEELDTLQQELKKHPRAFAFLEPVLAEVTQRQHFLRLKEEQRLHRNEPVLELLTLYADKKSGRVGDSRKKLQQRYAFMSYSEQVLVMKAMLQGPKTDREWCYNTLRKHWSDDFASDILSLWEEYHEERCGWLVTRNCSVEVIREHIDQLSYDSNYYALCKRLVSEPWFPIDKEKLRFNCGSDEKYLFILSQRRPALDEKEAMEFVYKKIVGAIFHNDTDTYADDRFLNRELSNQYFSCIYGKPESNFYMSDLKGMDKILASLCAMGFESAVSRFIEDDQKIHDDFFKIREFELMQAFSGTLPQDVYQYFVKEFVKHYAASFPAEYKYVFEMYEPYFMQATKATPSHDSGNNDASPVVPQNPAPQHPSEATPLTKEELEELTHTNPQMRYLIEQFSLEP